MGRAVILTLFVLWASGVSGGQQAASSSAAPAVKAQPAPVKVYSVGPGVTAPELLPFNLPPISGEECRRKQRQDGKVVLSLLVDTSGNPRNIMFRNPLGTEADRFSIHIANADRFNPGTVDGKPVVVAVSLEIGIQSCLVESKDSEGKTNYNLHLRSLPVQRVGSFRYPREEAVFAPDDALRAEYDGGPPHLNKVGGGVSAPVPLISPEAYFTAEARAAKYQGVCLISLIVDANGLPQNLQVKLPLKYGLTESAIAAVSKYRFKPAMKNGQPVPVEVIVEVNFKLY